MPLVELAVPVGDEPVPQRARDFIAEGERRIASLGRVLPAFVPSDHELVYRALCALRDDGALTGMRMVEWGSGLGIVAGLAAMLDYEAHAIEIEEELAEAGARLAADFGLSVEEAAGTFVPSGSEDLTVGVGDELEWLQPGGADAYESLGRDPAEFDLVFAYPWPGEEEIVLSLFERHAGHGGVLLTFHGLEGVRAHRAGPG
ncbi:MAG: hypothetical protein ACYTGZ_07105 [Planctomycetota bacterium]|jgi:hypothetical protein